MTDRGSKRRTYMFVIIGAIVVVFGAAYSRMRDQHEPESRDEVRVAAGGLERQSASDNAVADSPTASLRGKVIDQRDGPVVGAQVCAMIRDKQRSRLSIADRRRRHCTKSDAAGRFSLDDLEPVLHLVAATARAHIPANLEAWASNDPNHELTLRLRTGGVAVRGHVLDLSGGELAGAWVAMDDSPGGTTTDDAGAFELWGAPGRRYLVATSSGYAPGGAEIVAPTDEVEIYMAPESSLFGRVVDADTGEALAGVSIHASRVTNFYASWFAASYGGATITDDEGNFEIDQLTAGRFSLIVDDREAYGQHPGTVGLRLGQATGPIEVRAIVRSGTSFSGRLVDAESGQPVEDCSFDLRPAVHGVDAHGWVETERDGHFEGRFAPGEYRPRVNIMCPTHVMAADEPLLTLGNQPRDDLLFELQPAAIVSGTLLDDHGRPFDDAQVSVRSEQYSSGTRVDPSGGFRFTGLPPGSYELTAESKESPSTIAAKHYELGAGESVTDVALVLPRGATVSGTLTDQNGEGIEGAVISAVGQQTREAKSLAAGMFSIDGLADDTYAFKAKLEDGGVLNTPDGTNDVLASREIVAADSPVSIELKAERATATISGEVMDDDGPVGDAYVVATRESAGGGEMLAVNQIWNRQPALTEPDGSFTLRGLPEGEYTLRAFRQDGSEGYAEHVQTGTSTVITFMPTASLSGVAKSGDGEPLDEFAISMRDASTGGYRNETFIATDGSFRVDGLRAGTWTIVLMADGRKLSDELTLESGEDKTGYELALVAGVDVTGVVVDALSGEPVPGMLVGAGILGIGGRGEVSDADGRFTVADVPPGKATIFAKPRSMFDEGSYMSGAVTVTVPEGGADIGEVPVVPRTLRDGQNAGDFGIVLERGIVLEQGTQASIKIAAVRPGSPAAEAGVPVGCTISQMNGRAIGGNATLVHGFLHVPEGTTVRLGCDGETEVYSITAASPR